MPTKKPRYTVIVDDELLRRIDNFRFENRYPSRSAATLELIRLGMEAIEKQNESKGKGHAVYKKGAFRAGSEKRVSAENRRYERIYYRLPFIRRP